MATDNTHMSMMSYIQNVLSSKKAIYDYVQYVTCKSSGLWKQI